MREVHGKITIVVLKENRGVREVIPGSGSCPQTDIFRTHKTCLRNFMGTIW